MSCPGASDASSQSITLWVPDGPAFGDGRHETTQLCLQSVGALAPRTDGWRFLDWGSGTGILSIAAAKLGAARAVGVDIDEASNAIARANAVRNGVGDRVSFDATLPADAGRFELVVANILRGVLNDLAGEIASGVAGGGTLVLSGLVATDVPDVATRYASLLAGHRPEVYTRGEWRALVWRRVPARRNA